MSNPWEVLGSKFLELHVRAHEMSQLAQSRVRCDMHEDVGSNLTQAMLVTNRILGTTMFLFLLCVYSSLHVLRRRQGLEIQSSWIFFWDLDLYGFARDDKFTLFQAIFICNELRLPHYYHMYVCMFLGCLCLSYSENQEAYTGFEPTPS